jgi:hypothetical protein
MRFNEARLQQVLDGESNQHEIDRHYAETWRRHGRWVVPPSTHLSPQCVDVWLESSRNGKQLVGKPSPLSPRQQLRSIDIRVR